MRSLNKHGPSSTTAYQQRGASLSHFGQGSVLFREPSSANQVKSRDTNLLKPLANVFNLSYVAFGTNITDPMAPAYGSLNLSGKKLLDPAPITPIDSAAPFELLSGTIKAAFNSHRGIDGDATIIISPGISSGNTGKHHSAFGLCACYSVIRRYEALLEPYTSYLPVWTRSSCTRRLARCRDAYSQ